MEARLEAALRADGREVKVEASAVAADEVSEMSEAVVAPSEGAPNAWPEESIEAAMVSELRGRGEQPAAKPAREAPEESDNKSLPALNDLVQRLSPQVRETLDDLFRAKFVRVTRVPAKALKR